MKLYTLTAYLDTVKVGSGTVIEDHFVEQLHAQANEWFGVGKWNRLELAYYHRPHNDDFNAGRGSNPVVIKSA